GPANQNLPLVSYQNVDLKSLGASPLLRWFGSNPLTGTPLFTIDGTGSIVATGTQPADSLSNGTNANTVLQVTGGKGGATFTPGFTAGAGGPIVLTGGAGGDSYGGPGSTAGTGGSVTIQGGSYGIAATPGGAFGRLGNVLLAPSYGLVGVGTP